MQKKQVHKLKPVELFITDSTNNTGHMVGLSAEGETSMRQLKAYYRAIEDVLKGKGLMPYPRGDKIEPLLEISRKELENLIPDIHGRAKEIIKNEDALLEEQKKKQEAYLDAARVLRGETD